MSWEAKESSDLLSKQINGKKIINNGDFLSILWHVLPLKLFSFKEPSHQPKQPL